MSRAFDGGHGAAVAPTGNAPPGGRVAAAGTSRMMETREVDVSVLVPAKASKKKPGPDAEKLFNQLDANNDKFLSPAEFKNHTPAGAGKKKKNK